MKLFVDGFSFLFWTKKLFVLVRRDGCEFALPSGWMDVCVREMEMVDIGGIDGRRMREVGRDGI